MQLFRYVVLRCIVLHPCVCFISQWKARRYEIIREFELKIGKIIPFVLFFSCHSYFTCHCCFIFCSTHCSGIIKIFYYWLLLAYFLHNISSYMFKFSYGNDASGLLGEAKADWLLMCNKGSMMPGRISILQLILVLYLS